MSTTYDKSPTDVLRELDACSEAVEWMRELSPDDAWAKCVRGDWMLWLLGRVDDRRNLVALVCQCARLALPHDKSGTAIVAIETAERWVAGNADLDEVRRAASASSASAAAAAYTFSAASASASSASAAAASASSASAAASAYAASAYAAASAASAASDDNARKSTLKKCADIVRDKYPTPPDCVMDLLTKDKGL